MSLSASFMEPHDLRYQIYL